MKIIISYKGSWSNSFLKNSPNELEHGKVIESKTSSGVQLRSVDISESTVMGILLRLMGEERRLYQIQKDKTSFYHKLINNISFKHNQVNLCEREIVFHKYPMKVAPSSGSSGQKLEETEEVFLNEKFQNVLSCLFLPMDQVMDVIKNNNFSQIYSKKIDRSLCFSRLMELNRKKEKEYINQDSQIEHFISQDVKQMTGYGWNVSSPSLHDLHIRCYAMYKTLFNHIKNGENIKDNIAGISRQMGFMVFTPKDMNKKMVNLPKSSRGAPTIGKNRTNAEGFIHKKDGHIEVDIDLSKLDEDFLREAIDSAGVNVFCVGKKGIGWIDSIY